MQYGLIGERLGHSYSCEIHEAIADYRYELIRLRPDEVEGFLKRREFRGINVTIPYKQTVIPFLDGISETAERIGAVNTIVNCSGKLYGDNTDLAGMRELLVHARIEVRGRKVLILGTGGTSRTALTLMEDLGAREVLRVSRHEGAGAVTYAEAYERHGDAQVLVNATPVGMFPDGERTPVELSAFPALEGVIDAVYNPLRTELVLEAEARSIPAEGGLYMLAAQAVHASAAFLGKEAEPALIERAWRAVRHGKRSIVLTGASLSGTTAVGRLIAGRLRMPFYGVGASSAEGAGCVIAAGDGAVLREKDIRALKRIGVLVFLDRAAEETPAAQRMRTEADLAVPADDLPEAVADAVIKELEK